MVTETVTLQADLETTRLLDKMVFAFHRDKARCRILELGMGVYDVLAGIVLTLDRPQDLGRCEGLRKVWAGVGYVNRCGRREVSSLQGRWRPAAWHEVGRQAVLTGVATSNLLVTL